MSENSALTLQTEVNGNIRTTRCSGKLLSSSASRLVVEVKPFIHPGGTIILDLSDLTFMDSMGLGTIASLYVSAKVAGCTFELVNLSRRIRDLFTVTNLLSMFEAAGETDARII